MNRNLPIVLLITFFDFLAVSVFFGTIIPSVLDGHNIFQLNASVHERSFIYGLMLLILPVGQFLITPVWGQLSDQIGRKPILFVTLLMSCFGYVLMGFSLQATLFPLFIIGRVITACSATNMAIAQASLADVSEGKSKTQRFNLQFIFVSIGFIVGPYLIRATSHDINYQYTYWVVAGGYFCAFILIASLFTETLRFPEEQKMRWLLNVQYVFAIFKSGRLQRIFMVWIVFQLGWSLFFQYSGEFLYLKHHIPNDFINYLFSWVGVGIFVVQVLLVQPLSRRLPPQTILPWAVLAIGVSLIVMGFIPVDIGFYVFLGIYCLGIGFFLTNMSTYVSNLAQDDQQGRAMAMLASSQSLMDIVVTLIGSMVVSYYLPAPYVVGGAVILLSLLLWKRVVKS